MEKVPKETETIADKRAVRISERIKEAREKMKLSKAWWTSGIFEFFGLLILFMINLIVIMPLFGQPSESVSFSGPVVPIIAKGIESFGPPFVFATELTNIIFFLAFPITFYFFVKMISGRKFAAFLSALIATLPFYLFAKTRIQFGLLGSEAPFIASLTIVPLAIMSLLSFLRTGGIKNLIWASLASAFTALISPFGVFIFLILSLITVFSEILLGEGRLKILRLLTVFFFAGCLSSFWYNPGFFLWLVTGPMGEGIRGMVRRLIPISLFAVPVLASLGYLLFDRKPNLQPFFLALFYSIAFLIIVIAGGGFAPSNPGRYVPILGLCLSFLIGVSVLNVTEYLKDKFPKMFFLSGLKDFLLLAFSGIISTSILLYKDTIYSENTNVLGIWTDVKKGDIWVATDYFAKQYSIFGYVITLFGISLLLYLYFNYQRKSGI